MDGICRPAKKPVFAGEEGICAGCGVATLSISYYDLGYTTGEMAVKILNGEADVSSMPIEYTDVTKKYNKAICDDLGLKKCIRIRRNCFGRYCKIGKSAGRFAGCLRTGPYLGHHGHWRVSDLPHFGCG